jgi:hypothetical protein
MKQRRIIRPGLVTRAERNILQGLHPSVQIMFRTVLNRIRLYLEGSDLQLSAPHSEKWITVKLHPRKAVLAFRQDKFGNLKFDIDTYAHNDISNPGSLFRFIENRNKPNKRHTARIRPNTSPQDLEHFIDKMIEGMHNFDASR